MTMMMQIASRWDGSSLTTLLRWRRRLLTLGPAVVHQACKPGEPPRRVVNVIDGFHGRGRSRTRARFGPDGCSSGAFVVDSPRARVPCRRTATHG
jgi:hypothetical protein